MSKLTNWQFLSIFFVIVLILNACGNSTATNNKPEMNNQALQTEDDTRQMDQPAPSIIKEELDKAKKAGKAVFVVVTGNGIAETNKAVSIAEGAKVIYKNAVVVQMNRDEVANAQLVNEWRLTGAPLPLILVFSPKGQLTGGKILAQATAENIAALVPSPKLEDVYDAVAASKPALVVFTKKSLTDRTEVLKECKEAISRLKNNAVLVEVDMDDTKEVNFMNQLRIDKTSTVSTTLVINTQGQVAGTSTSVPDATKLVSAATAPVKSGCGSGCGPAGCGK